MQGIISFIMSHEGILAGLGVGILDLVFALLPKIAANGILHWVYLQLSQLKSK